MAVASVIMGSNAGQPPTFANSNKLLPTGKPRKLLPSGNLGKLVTSGHSVRFLPSDNYTPGLPHGRLTPIGDLETKYSSQSSRKSVPSSSKPSPLNIPAYSPPQRSPPKLYGETEKLPPIGSPGKILPSGRSGQVIQSANSEQLQQYDKSRQTTPYSNSGQVTVLGTAEQLPPQAESRSSTMNPGDVQTPTVADWMSTPRKQAAAVDLNYMHRPPTILPNYGKRKGVLKLKTNVPRVLLFDNVTQQSMLEVALSGLQSQRHKLDRELNMQAKSFLRRRQMKDRLLKNLTKVHHGQDYLDFEREYNGHSQRLAVETRSVAGVNGQEDETGVIANRATTLPQITLNQPGSARSAPSLQQFSPRRNVGFRIEQNAAGITQLFHAHHDDTGPETSALVATQNSDAPTAGPDNNNNTITTLSQDNAGAADDVEQDDQPARVNPISKLSRFPPRLKKLEDKSGGDEDENADPKPPQPQEPVYEAKVDTKVPVRDHRFQKLQGLLVKQEPPNDGFIELSPSFTRNDGPVTEIRARLKKLGYLEGSEPLEGSARSYNSDEAMSADDGFSTEDEGNDEEA